MAAETLGFSRVFPTTHRAFSKYRVHPWHSHGVGGQAARSRATEYLLPAGDRPLLTPLRGCRLHSILRRILTAMPIELPPFKARQVHGIHADGKVFTEPLGCLACLYSQVGEPHAASCVSICMSQVVAPAPHRGTCPHGCLSSSTPPAGSPSLFKY